VDEKEVDLPDLNNRNINRFLHVQLIHHWTPLVRALNVSLRITIQVSRYKIQSWWDIVFLKTKNLHQAEKHLMNEPDRNLTCLEDSHICI
jgi:hypothetical protein